MAYTTQKTVVATSPEGEPVDAGLIDRSVQARPQKEVLERETVRYAPALDLVLAPNTDDDVNPGILVEEWSE